MAFGGALADVKTRDSFAGDIVVRIKRAERWTFMTSASLMERGWARSSGAAIKSRRDGFIRMGIGSEIVHRGRRKPGYSAGRRRSHKKPHGLAPQLFWLAFIVGGNELELIAGMATFTNAGGLATLLEALQEFRIFIGPVVDILPRE